MKDPYLVQRLNPPSGTDPLSRVIETFSFGGGSRNGGLSKEAMALLRPIFSFDYMGAAEFEFGAVPKALSKMADLAGVGKSDRAKRKVPGLSSFEFVVTHPLRPVDATPTDFVAGDTFVLYGIAETGTEIEVAECVQRWLLPHGERPHMREPPLLDRALDGDEWVRTVGWLSLDPPFFVFRDRAMWERTANLFQAEVKV